jgi:hypothetical protein
MSDIFPLYTVAFVIVHSLDIALCL